MAAYVYIRSEPGLWTVGFHHPDGSWEPGSDHGSEHEAAEQVARLNGGGCDCSEAVQALHARIAELENVLATTNGDGSRRAFTEAMDYLR